LCGRITQVSRYQKGKTNLDLLGQEIVSGIGISWAICKSAPHPRQITTPASYRSSFHRHALPAAQPTVSKHCLCRVICLRRLLFLTITRVCDVMQLPVTSSDNVTRNLLPHLLQVPRPAHPVVCKSPSLPPTFEVSAFKYDDGKITYVLHFQLTCLKKRSHDLYHLISSNLISTDLISSELS